MVSIVTCLFVTPVAHAQGDAKRIIELESFRGFAGMFNLGQGAVRAVALVSTSSEGSAERLEEFYDVVSSIETNRFRAYVLFVGGEAGKEDPTEQELAKKCTDKRVAFFRDPTGVSIAAWETKLGGHMVRGDAYFIYDTDARMADAPEQEAVWMNGAKKDDAFDGSNATARVRKLLDKLEKSDQAKSE